MHALSSNKLDKIMHFHSIKNKPKQIVREIKVHKSILLRTLHSNLLQDVKITIIVNKIKDYLGNGSEVAFVRVHTYKTDSRKP